MSSQITDLTPRPLLLAGLIWPGSGHWSCRRRCRGSRCGNPGHLGGDRPGPDGPSGGDAGTSYLVLGGLLVLDCWPGKTTC